VNLSESKICRFTVLKKEKQHIYNFSWARAEEIIVLGVMLYKGG